MIAGENEISRGKKEKQLTAVLCFSHQLLKLNKVTQAFFFFSIDRVLIKIKKITNSLEVFPFSRLSFREAISKE